MSEKLEQTMKKIHIYLANCKESAYSSEDLIVSKKRMYSLLEELNYAGYEVMEEYEATVAARDRGLAMVERQATEIREDAMHRAEDVYAASLLYTQESIVNLQNALEYTYEKTKREYETLMANHEEKLMYLERDAQEIVSQLTAMADSKKYLRMIDEINERKRLSVLEEEESNSKKLGSAEADEAYDVPKDEFESKLSAQIVVAVHDTPKIPEGFGKGKKKKKGKGSSPEAAATVASQELDAEYFAFQEEQQQALADQLEDEEKEEAPDFLRDALKLFTKKKPTKTETEK